MMRITRALLALTVGGLGTVAVAQPAQATDETYETRWPVDSACHSDWYVNWDENGNGVPPGDDYDVRPTQTEDGFLFDSVHGSLVHHEVTGLLLKDLEPGSLVQSGAGGDLHLRVEVYEPYSSFNYVGDGTTNLWWSTGIAAGDEGGQGKPHEPAWFMGQTITTFGGGTYDEETAVISIGTGYGGTTAGGPKTVSSITFNGVTYDLMCKTEPTQTETKTAEPTGTTETTTQSTETSGTRQTSGPKETNGTKETSGTTTEPASTTSSEAALAKTGSSLTPIFIAGAVLIIGGASVLGVVGWRRRRES